MKTAPADTALPLFDWPERNDVAGLEEQRRELKARIDRMRPRSERRIELEAHLRELTTKQLRLIGRLRGKRHG